MCYQVLTNICKQIGAAQIENNFSEKLLDVKIDTKLSFEKHIE